MKQQKKMQRIYLRGGNVAESKFNYSLLKPVGNGASFDSSKLKPLDEQIELPNMPEEEGFLSKLPRNIAIGLAHGGRNLANVPHDLVKGFEQGTQGIGNLFQSLPGNELMPRNKKNLSEYLPYDTMDYAETFGQKGEGTLMDNLLQKGIEYAPEIVAGGGALKAGLRASPITYRGASRQLKKLDKMMAKLENESEIYPHMPLSEELIEEAKPFLPKTHATREMLNDASMGLYKPSFSFQSQIGHHERALAKSPLASENLLAPKAREVRQMALNEMETALRSNGYNKEADLLRGGLDDYRKYIKFREEVKPLLKKIGIPGTMLGVLGAGYKYGKKIFD